MKMTRYAAWGIAGLLFLIHVSIVTIHTALAIKQDAIPGSAAIGYWTLVMLTAFILAAGLKKGRIAGSKTYLLMTATLPDFYTGRELRYRTEDGLLRHPGRDGVFDTQDDVVLGEKR